MIRGTAVDIVKSWQEAANNQDTDRLIQLSAPDIEIAGPRGSGYGHQLLRDWLARAGLQLQTRRIFGRNGNVVVAQQGIWHAPETGAIVGEQPVASSFRVAAGQVTRVARYDNLDAALSDVGLTEDDEVTNTRS